MEEKESKKTGKHQNKTKIHNMYLYIFDGGLEAESWMAILSPVVRL